MKLEIDLMNADEVAAGLVLLGKIGESQAEEKGAVRTLPTMPTSPTPGAANANVASFIARTQVEDGEVFYQHGSKELDEDAKKLEGMYGPGTAGLTAAEVFGGASPLVPPTTVPPAVTVPSVPNPPIPGPATSVELDAKGLPWDSRIHSSSKNKLANGCWKIARGKDPEYVAQVEAELKGGTPANAFVASLVAAIPAPPSSLNVPSATPFPNVADAPYSASIPPAPNADPSSFETLMTRISPQISAGVLPPQAVMEACKTHGLQSVVALQSSPEFVPLVWASLKSTYPGLV